MLYKKAVKEVQDKRDKLEKVEALIEGCRYQLKDEGEKVTMMLKVQCMTRLLELTK